MVKQCKTKFGAPEVCSRHQNNKGQWFTVLETNGCKDVLIEFDERQYQKRVPSYYIRSGGISMPSIFVGDIVKDRFGTDVKVISINTVQRVTFEWPDGVTRICQASVVSRGNLLHPKDSQKITPAIKVGDRFKTWQGCDVEVVKYESAAKITIRFFEPHEFNVVTTQGNLSKGNIHNYFVPSVCGVGIVEMYPHDNKGKMYRSWSGMLKRVYSPANEQTANTYRGCSVRSDWHKLENFAVWFDKQVLKPDWHLDKDLLVKGNRMYSEDTCIFLPRDLNVFLTDRANHRGKWPIGVAYHARISKWEASCNIHGTSEYLGVHGSPEAAFAAYKDRKEAYAKELAAKWKDQIDPRAYQALMGYTVEITD